MSVLWSALKIKSETLSFDLLAIEQVSFVPQQILNPPHRVHLLCFLRVNPALPGLSQYRHCPSPLRSSSSCCSSSWELQEDVSVCLGELSFPGRIKVETTDLLTQSERDLEGRLPTSLITWR
jgi:hypothetical protein